MRAHFGRSGPLAPAVLDFREPALPRLFISPVIQMPNVALA
jgi:hypothetical protein